MLPSLLSALAPAPPLARVPPAHDVVAPLPLSAVGPLVRAVVFNAAAAAPVVLEAAVTDDCASTPEPGGDACLKPVSWLSASLAAGKLPGEAAPPWDAALYCQMQGGARSM